MAKTWIFRYYAWFGPWDLSEDVEYEAEVSEEEYAFLTKLEAFPDKKGEDFKAFLRENGELILPMENRIGSEIEEYEGIDCTVFDDEEEESVFTVCDEEDEAFEDEEDEWAEEDATTEPEEDRPELRIRWPWERF